MKGKLTFASLVLVVATTLALLGFIVGGLSVGETVAAELRVCPVGCPYTSIQAAVDAAQPGDIIKIAQGTYSDVQNVPPLNTGTFTATQIVAVTQSITLRGGYNDTFTVWDPDTYPTILDAGGQGRGVAVVGAGIAPTIEGLRITGGDAADLGGVWIGSFWTGHSGGGIYVYQATAVISDCEVTGNTAPIGGGVTLFHSDGALTGNAIHGNTASDGGGSGVYLFFSPALLRRNTVYDNQSDGGWGGGINVSDGSAILEHNVIYSNTTDLYGGGISLSSADATLTGNRIFHNTGDRGGGVHVYLGNTILTGNVITSNVSPWRGGGLELNGGAPALVNNVVADNQVAMYGAGIYIERSAAQLHHTTVARNTGGDGAGIHVTDDTFDFSTVVLTNTILSNQTVGITVTAGNTATLNGVLWNANGANMGGDGGHTSLNDRFGDPAFDADGYHLMSGSMAIDRGVNTGVATDIDDETRPQGAGPDLGADEFPSTPPAMIWDKRVRIGGGAFQAWDSGPFTVTPGESVTVVDRVWVTATGSVSFTLGETWTDSLNWSGYDATAGNVSQTGNTASWQVQGAAANTWHVLTKTLAAVASPTYAGVLTETLTVAGASPQLPERILHFQHPRPEPAWEKTVQVNAGAPQPWNTGPFNVQDGDTVTVVDRVWVTHTTGVSFTLAQTWGPGLALTGQNASTGATVVGSQALTWQAPGAPGNHWHTLTTTLSVNGAAWLYETLTETLTVADATAQLPQRQVELLNMSGAAGCHVRVNDGPAEYHTVQDGVDAAQEGDVVKVAGRCAIVNTLGGHSQIAYLTKAITVRGGYTTTNWTTPDPVAHPTTLDAEGKGRVLYIAGNIAPTIEGLRITGGKADDLGGMPWGDVGGGIYINGASALVSDTLIYNNTAPHAGGGVFVVGGAATLANNVIEENEMPSGGTGAGIALYTSDAAVRNNVVRNNEAHDWGGGIQISGGAPTVSGNTITGNYVVNSGGGVVISDNSTAQLENNLISGNQANGGAGVWTYFADPVLRNNRIENNVAGAVGGGLFLEGGSPLLINNVVIENQTVAAGSGIYAIRTQARLVHTTIARNTHQAGGDSIGVYVTDRTLEPSTIVLTNTIIAGQTTGIFVTAGSSASLNATLWYDNGANWSGAGTITRANDHTGDPAFAGDGYHLTGGSVAVDRGVNAGATTDIDGETRPLGGGYEIGADEFLMRIFLPLALRSG